MDTPPSRLHRRSSDQVEGALSPKRDQTSLLHIRRNIISSKKSKEPDMISGPEYLHYVLKYVVRNIVTKRVSHLLCFNFKGILYISFMYIYFVFVSSALGTFCLC